MPLLGPERARAIAEDWIAAWNAHDLDRVMSHYADELHFVSPLIVARSGRADGAITAKAELRAYFAGSLGADSVLRFELLTVCAGVDCLTLIYRNHRGQEVAETKQLDAGGRACAVQVCHRPAGGGQPGLSRR